MDKTDILSFVISKCLGQKGQTNVLYIYLSVLMSLSGLDQGQQVLKNASALRFS